MCALSNDSLDEIGCLKEGAVAHSAVEGLEAAIQADLPAEDLPAVPDEEQDEQNELVVEEDWYCVATVYMRTLTLSDIVEIMCCVWSLCIVY